MMSQAIQDFPSQFSYTPKIEGAIPKKKFQMIVVLGMGGSHLAADLYVAYTKAAHIVVWKNYGLPPNIDPKTTLVIASSYSGNTEEVLHGFDLARKKKISVLCIAVGGELLVRAKKFSIPFIALPDTGIQPRSALGYSFMALTHALGDKKTAAQAKKLAQTLQSEKNRAEGEALAKVLQQKIPLIYSASEHEALVYNWKIKFNETGKIPAFYNVVPELNHNEMTGFDVGKKGKKLVSPFAVILLRDEKDRPQVQKRMDTIQTLYEARGLSVHTVPLQGGALHGIFSSLLLADWTALALAKYYDHEPEQVPMVEEFKRLLRA